MESIPITCLNIQKQVKTALLLSGIATLSVLSTSNLHTLTTDITHDQIDLIRKITDALRDRQSSFSSLLTSPSRLCPRECIPLTSSSSLFLNCVFGLGEVTEIVGGQSVGKTQLAMQLCLNAQLPKEMGGQEGEALFIDTKGDFSVDRLAQMAKCFRMKAAKEVGDWEPEEAILSKVGYFRVMDEDDQMKLMFSLEKILKRNTKIRVIAVDVWTLYLKTSEGGYGERKRILSNVLVRFITLAKKYRVAIILVNTLKTRRDKDQGNKLEPNYGEVMFQSVTNRVMIERDMKLGDDIFKASLLKGSIFYQMSGSFEMHFQVKESGISTKID